LDRGRIPWERDWWRTGRSILLPLIRPALFSCFALIFILCSRSTSQRCSCSAPGSEVIGTTMLQFWQNGDNGPGRRWPRIQVGLTFVFVYLGAACCECGSMAELRVERLVKLFGEVRAVDDIFFTWRRRVPDASGASGVRQIDHAGGDRRAGEFGRGAHRFGRSGVPSMAPWRVHAAREARGRAGVPILRTVPHMTVAENLEFPLRLRKCARQRAQRVQEALALVEMSYYGLRYHSRLSGASSSGWRWRARWFYRPALCCWITLVEPWTPAARAGEKLVAASAAHAAVTTVYVTHDKSEALALSDRIAVMTAARSCSWADPHTIYERPANPFVADFIGKAAISCGVSSRRRRSDRARTLTALPSSRRWWPRPRAR